MRRRLYSFFILVFLVCVACRGVVVAASSDISGAVTQSYNAGPSVLTAMIVGFKSKDQTTVVPLTSKNIHGMLGVVVPVKDEPIVLTPQATSTQQVLVAVSGRHNLLVSNQNGPVKANDYVTISSLDGIGMKADANQTEVVGRAAAGFSGSGNAIGTISLKGSLGHSTTVSIGYIPVDVHLAPNPMVQTSSLPGFLTRAANGVSNKPVSPARLYTSSVVLLATLFVTAVMLYSGVRNGIVAVGRNPLAKKSISRSLIQTTIAGLIIFTVGVFATYIVLNY